MRGPSEYANYSPGARRIAFALDLLAAPLFGSPGNLEQRSLAKAAPRRILLIRPDHVGDLLMATPAIRALRRALPEAEIELLTSPWGVQAVRGNPDLDRVRTIEATWFEPLRGDGPDPSRLISELLALRVKGPDDPDGPGVPRGPDGSDGPGGPDGPGDSRPGGRYDAAADLRGDFRSILIALASGARRRVGFSRLGLEALLTDATAFDPTLDHVSRNHAIVRLLGAGPLAERRPVFVVPASAEQAADRLVMPLPPGRPIVAVYPGTNRPWASWGAVRFAEAARLIARARTVSIVADGRKADRPAAESVAAAAGAEGAVALNLAGETDLAQAAAVIRRASVLLANDSGAAHLAVAVGTPVVSIFGPTDPALCWTWDRPDRNVALAGSSSCTRPCFRISCAGDHGYSSIAPAEVAALLGRLIDAGREANAR